jgi:hypothetical protein
MLRRNGAFSSKHSVSIHNNSGDVSKNTDFCLRRSPTPAPCLPPNLVREERIFWMQRQATSPQAWRAAVALI